MKKESLSVNNLVVDLNFLQLTKYFFSQRYFVAIFILAFPAMIGLWMFFVNKPVYTSTVKLTVDLGASTSAFEDRVSFFYLQEQEAQTKINKIDELVSSKLFRAKLEDFFDNSTEILSKYPDAKKQLNLVNNFLINSIKPKQKLNSRYKANVLFSKIDFGSDVEKRNITISTSTRFPVVSSAMANLVVYVLLEYNHKEILRKEESIINFLSQQTKKLEIKLNSLEEEYVELQKKYKIYSEDVVLNQSNLLHINNKQALDKIARDLRVHQMVAKNLKNELLRIQGTVGKNNRSSVLYLAQLQKRLDLLNYQNAVKKKTRTPSSLEESRQVEERIEEVMASYKANLSRSRPYLTVSPLESLKRVEKQILDIEDKVFELRSKKQSQLKLIEQTESKIKNLPKATRELVRLKRRINLTSNLFKELAVKLQETRVREAGQVNDLKIITYAEPVGRPAGIGVKKSLVLASLVGLVFALGLLLLKFVLIPTVRDASDLEKMGIKVIGTLPFYRSRKNTILSIGTRPSIVLKDNASTYEANLIRNTRFLLQKEIDKRKRLYTAGSGGGHLISVCSANANEGKTFFATNLAYSLSKTEQKVLLIDVDFMKPDVKDYFQKKRRKKTRLLKFNNFSMRLRSVEENFDILDAPMSRENIADQLQGKSFRKMITQLRSEYDIILFDTPAIDGFLEPMVVSQYTDLILFVVNQRITLIDEIKSSLKKINDGSTENVLGVINFTYEDFKVQKKMNQSA